MGVITVLFISIPRLGSAVPLQDEARQMTDLLDKAWWINIKLGFNLRGPR